MTERHRVEIELTTGSFLAVTVSDDAHDYITSAVLGDQRHISISPLDSNRTHLVSVEHVVRLTSYPL